MSYQRLDDPSRPPSTAPHPEGYQAEGVPNATPYPVANYSSISSSTPPVAVVPVVVAAVPVSQPVHHIPAVVPYAPVAASSSNFIGALPGSGQPARLCQMKGCTRSKGGSSHFCSGDHEQKHLTELAQRNNLSAICTRYLGTSNATGAFRCMTCEYRPHQHCCASCVIVCHQGHDVVEIKGGSSAPCACGGDSQCSCMPRVRVTPTTAGSRATYSALGKELGSRDQCYQRSHGAGHQQCVRCSRWLCTACVHVHEGRVVCPPCYTSAREADCCMECMTWCCVGLCLSVCEAMCKGR